MDSIQPTLIIGLTGGIGSGKSEVSRRFHALGIDIIDADVIARDVVESGTAALEEISNHFGREILLANGTLNRKQLRDIIFKNTDEKKWLESLLHPLIHKTLQQQLTNSASIYTLLVSPLLLETEQVKLVDMVLVVDCEPQTQISRALQRDNTQAAAIKAIMATQLDRTTRLSRADNVIENNGGIAQLNTQVQQLHNHYLFIAKKHTNDKK